MTESHSAPNPEAEGEPETPTWLPALGFVLFVATGLAWAITAPTTRDAAPPAAASVGAPEPAQSVAPIQRAVPPPTANQAPSPAPPPARPSHTAGVAHRDGAGRPAKKRPAVP